MKGAFYPRLAASSIRKNGRTYIPFMLTCVFTIAMYYIMKSLSLNNGLNNAMVGGGASKTVLDLGTIVIAVFAFIFLFYTNSFLLKSRKKEFGLFSILGMEKRHIARVMFFESLYVFAISLVLGLGAGILFDKLMFAAILRLMKLEIPLGFHISPEAVLKTVLIFAVIFALIFLNSLRLIHFSKPIELLKGGSIGEKEPKAKWLPALLGIGCLAAGYWMSLSIKNPVAALTLFLAAVIFVMIGTYLLFTAVSITLLKVLKRSKGYYYKTSHFISVSGMMYRMKQNAVGLANICVLSTMVLVCVSSTISLFAGINGIIDSNYPTQFQIHRYNCDDEEFAHLVSAVNRIAEKKGVEITNGVTFSKIEFMAVNEGDSFRCGMGVDDFSTTDNTYSIYAVTAADYEAVMGTSYDLRKNEVIVWQDRNKYPLDHFDLFGERYEITGRADGFFDSYQSVMKDVVPTFGMIVSDREVLEKLNRSQMEVYGPSSSSLVSLYFYDTDLPESQQDEFFRSMEQDKDFDIDYYGYNNRAASKKQLTELYGSIFFLGIFLGLLFTVATVLIIYYKQISEGIEDKKRFEIMQKVGMGEDEIRRSISSQVLTVFFMPLMTAGVHTAFAFPMVRKILAMMQLTDVKLFAMCTAGSFLVFALIYAVIYFLTSRVYYRIVKTVR